MQLSENIFWVGGGICGLSQEKDSHIYLLKDKHEAALIDAGCGIDVNPLLNNIKKTGTELNQIKYVFLTHAHADHSGGAAILREYFDFKLVISNEEQELIEKGTEWELGLTLAKRSGFYPEDYKYQHTKVDICVDDSSAFKIGDILIKTIVVPGHSHAGVCYLAQTEGGNSLFSGDTVFLKGLISLLNCPGSDINAYRDNITKLSGLNIQRLFPGHDLWTLRNGQKHIDMAIKNLSTTKLPQMKI